MQTEISVNRKAIEPSLTVSYCQHCEKFSGRVFKLLIKSARDSIQYSGACLVGAAAAHYIFPYATIPLLATSCTIFATRTVDKILQKIPSERIKSALTIAAKSIDLDKKYPKASTIMLLFSIALSPFFPSLSISIGVAYGIYMGLNIDNKKNREENTPEDNIAKNNKNLNRKAI